MSNHETVMKIVQDKFNHGFVITGSNAKELCFSLGKKYIECYDSNKRYSVKLNSAKKTNRSNKVKIADLKHKVLVLERKNKLLIKQLNKFGISDNK